MKRQYKQIQSKRFPGNLILGTTNVNLDGQGAESPAMVIKRPKTDGTANVVVITDKRLAELLSPTGDIYDDEETLAAFHHYADLLFGGWCMKEDVYKIMEAVANYYPETLLQKPNKEDPKKLQRQLERDRVEVRVDGKKLDLY